MCLYVCICACVCVCVCVCAYACEHVSMLNFSISVIAYYYCCCSHTLYAYTVCTQECENFTKDAFNALHQLLVELLLKQISSENLESIYKVYIVFFFF